MINSLTFLGTGTSVGVPMIGCPCIVCQSQNPKDKRLRTSAWVELDSISILIDIGPDFRMQALTHNITKLDAIVLTHPHRDHIGGFDDIRALNFLYEKKVDLYTNQYTWDSLKKQFYYAFEKSDYTSMPSAHFHCVENDSFFIHSMEILPIQVIHGSMPCLGYRFGKMAYITDMSAIEDKELEKLYNLDILVIDALRQYPHPSHLTVNEALTIIEKVKPKNSYLTHISHHMGYHDKVQEVLPENVFLAYDGLKLKW